ncbi:MAG: RNA-binding S4 domain-containing protein [Epsilonproteobacteria bacterium]|nr:MAG: RNA-binding S4 domain-containing protein [Campylobacterota bacterium]
MRIDKFLNAVNITKRRAVATDMINSSTVFINGAVIKKAKDVKIGDKITIKYLEYEKNYEILEIPHTKSTAKSQQECYIRLL